MSLFIRRMPRQRETSEAVSSLSAWLFRPSHNNRNKRSSFESVGMAIPLSSSHQFLLVIAKPVPSLLIIRNHLLHFSPKRLRMIHMYPMAQLMHHHIIHYLFRRSHENAVKVKIPFRTAASPSRLLIPYRDPSVCHPNKLRKLPYLYRYDPLGPRHKESHLLIADGF